MKGINQNEESEEEATEEVWLSRIRNVLDTKPIEKAHTDSGIKLAHRITGKLTWSNARQTPRLMQQGKENYRQASHGALPSTQEQERRTNT